ncbi:ABC transporter ATP-binding protein [Kitasatospora sp. NPDC049285]|uniref:ABC transporter ATP-binding protein n=1 Tax=Kitasatospora sp. NPDC049285 TaxID=3157096 RepID=UPI0034381B1C
MNELPIASPGEVRAHAKELIRGNRPELAGTLVLHALATVAGLVAPWMIGRLIQDAGRHVDTAALTGLVICLAVIAQSLLERSATFGSVRLGEKVLAGQRERFVDRVLALPLTTVERAGAGDLITRTTRDVDVLARTVQLAAPDAMVALTTVLLTLGAIALVSPVLVLPCLVAVPVLWASTRWYLRRARPGYLRANASYSRITETIAQTVDGARTVEALGVAEKRFAQLNRDIAESYAAERYTLWLRSVYLPIADTGYILPVVATMAVGGVLYLHGVVTLAAATAATLYVQQLIGPVDRLLFWMDELQVGGASLARILGVGTPAESPAATAAPAAGQAGDTRTVELRGVRYAYREGHDVLHGVDLVIRPGERLAVVGASGAGKSTLGRLLAGVDRPGAGSVTIGGASLADLPLAELRRRVAMVTQEHHVFTGTLRDNLIVARPDAGDQELERALRAVDAWDWAAELGLDARLGAGATRLSPPQAGQLALARLVLADPYVLVLDEATAMLDPRAARHLERSLAAVLEGRTVIAVAHRLHTAHDADRVVVMEDGRIVEVGPHDELVAKGGHYAALWTSWHGQDEEVPR